MDASPGLLVALAKITGKAACWIGGRCPHKDCGPRLAGLRALALRLPQPRRSFAHPQFPSRGPRPQDPEEPAHHPAARAVRRADVLPAQQVGAQVIGRYQRAIGSREQLRTTNGAAPSAIGEERGADVRGGEVVVYPTD